MIIASTTFIVMHAFPVLGTTEPVSKRHLATLRLLYEVLHELDASAHGEHCADLVEEALGSLGQLLVLVVRQLIQQLHKTHMFDVAIC